jgi:hypothetical protein
MAGTAPGRYDFALYCWYAHLIEFALHFRRGPGNLGVSCPRFFNRTGNLINGGQ